MIYTDRPATHSTPYLHRPVVGAVLHDTEGAADLTTFESAGGWHWLVGRRIDPRTGVASLYADCDEAQAAWHVEAQDRWRPPWLLKCPNKKVSDTNYCTLGIEITSCQAFRDAGVPYTAAQYTALRTLILDIESRYGPLWYVGHGELQKNRSDPVQFDWERAGFGPRGENGRRFLVGAPPGGTPVPILSDQQAEEIAQRDWGVYTFNPETAIGKSWLVEWRSGRWRGLPLTGEEAITGTPGAVSQRFEFGRASYVPGKEVSWDA